MCRPFTFLLILSFLSSFLYSQEHPNLTLTVEGVKMIRSEMSNAPLFIKAVDEAKKEIDKEIELGVLVPIPKDMAGGYTHERHKRNWVVLQMAGNLYQITQEEKYAKYIKESLLAYAKMYPTLPLHPTQKSYATGKIFWQCLNDANWLVYVSQAYDCIYNYLSEEERAFIEEDLFRPYADFLSTGNPKFFNRIHNHSAWANSAVGMIGLVMNDKELIERSLYGLKDDGINENEVDNDGGYIKVKGTRKAGFLAQLDYSFSPDGYFTEGPYYLRYAIFPFLIYSKALQNHKPELDIFNYRNSILEKAVDGLLQQTDATGNFFPINDALKGMSLKAKELITAVDMMYAYRGENPEFLSIAEKQNKVLIDETGFAVAKGIEDGKSEVFNQKSILFGDGKDGTEGGVAVLRDEETCLVMKYSAQGMGHGHFDKLSYSLYDDTGEVLQDYGSVRWVNIDQKGGGRYLPENKTFGKQSITHNTLVIDEVSHYNASVKNGEEHHPELYASDIDNPKLQLISAKDNNAYKDAKMHRSLYILEDEAFNNPLIIDIFRSSAEEKKQFDLPHWYLGHLLGTSVDYKKEMTAQKPLGTNYGYQHLWNEGMGSSDEEQVQMTWFGNRKFYTLTAANEIGDEYIFARAGANDKHFNLRPDPVFIHRRKEKESTTFVNVVESHGTYNKDTEVPLSPFSAIQSLEVIKDDCDYTVIRIRSIAGGEWILAQANKENDKSKNHKVKFEGGKLKWTGVYKLFKNEK